MMARIRALLVDDEPSGLAVLEKLLQVYCPEIDVVATSLHAEEALDHIQALRPDLVFLDIKLPGKTGIELLREFDSIPFEVIFVTAYSDFMIQAFHFSAVDYLLKPVDEDLLVQAVKRAGERIRQKTGNPSLVALAENLQMQHLSMPMKLCIPSVKGFQVIELSDILFCEAFNSYTNFHCLHHPMICASKPIHEYERLLEDCHFLRIHKSYLINLQHIKEYIRGEGGSVILANGHQIEVSRRKKELLMERMKAHYKF